MIAFCVACVTCFKRVRWGIESEVSSPAVLNYQSGEGILPWAQGCNQAPWVVFPPLIAYFSDFLGPVGAASTMTEEKQ